MKVEARDRLIVALDVSGAGEAETLVRRLRDCVGVFKIGLQLYTAHGPDLVHRIVDSGSRVFLDLKLHDIPNTVGNAVSEACRLGVHMLTLHTLGGRAMLRRAREAVDSHGGAKSTRLLGVTVLTSLHQADIEELGFRLPVSDLVGQLAQLAAFSGLDGIVCSPQELSALQESGPGGLLFVTPGIRASGSEADDQARTLCAAEAIRLGASHLVVGRPIIKAPDPEEAAHSFLREIESAMLEI